MGPARRHGPTGAAALQAGRFPAAGGPARAPPATVRDWSPAGPPAGGGDAHAAPPAGRGSGVRGGGRAGRAGRDTQTPRGRRGTGARRTHRDAVAGQPFGTLFKC